MALRIRFQHPTGATLGYSIERLSDGLFYDFSMGTFAASPTAPIANLPADTGHYSGRYKATLSPTPAAQFTDGQYGVAVHDLNASNLVVGQLELTMYGGDDAPVFPTAGGSQGDPWATPLPGNYPAGTAGAILGGNLDAMVSSRLAASSYTAAPSVAQIAAGVWDEPGANHVTPGSFGARLDAAVSTRYDGQADVPGVASPVTVGVNHDKAGYVLASDGLDTVPVEPGVNARQALAPILAASAGVVSGSGSGTIVIKGGNTATTRIMATTDSAGNRSAVTLMLPS